MVSGSTGNCYLCGAELSKTAMKNHLLKDHGSDDGGQACCLLKIEGAHNKDYWLFIDLPMEKSLSDIDRFLRKIWLECCGHLSAFYASGRGEVAKSKKLSAFSAGDQLTHEYDFGTTTETTITIVGTVTRKPQKGVVRLLARNAPPQFKCATCKAPAEYICTECVYDTDNPFVCAGCADEHEHDDMLLPVTNSPRMGECGYDGAQDVYAFISPKG